MSMKSRVILWLSKLLSTRIALAIFFLVAILGIKTAVAAVIDEPQPLGEPFDDDENFF